MSQGLIIFTLSSLISSREFAFSKKNASISFLVSSLVIKLQGYRTEYTLRITAT